MLQRILSNFSEDELFSFLNRTSVDFAMKMTQPPGVTEGLNKKQLSAIIANTKQLMEN